MRSNPKTNQSRIVLKSSNIRKHNAYLRNWANRTESDNLANLILDGIIMAESGKAVLKGVIAW